MIMMVMIEMMMTLKVFFSNDDEDDHLDGQQSFIRKKNRERLSTGLV